MKVIIRDDDISYFTDIKQLEKVYKKAWRKGYVTHLAVIPFIKSPGTAVPEKQRHKKGTFPIGKNRELVAYLKRKIAEGKVAIMQHGITHEDFGEQFEMEHFRKADCERLRKGKKHLEEIFNLTIDTFVAPHDRFSKRAIRCVEQCGFHYISRCFAPLPREIQFHWTYIKSYLKLVCLFFQHGTSRKYPLPLDFGKHTAFFSYRLEELKKANIDDILAFHQNGVLSITIHSKGMSDEQIRFFNHLLSKIEGQK